ncbi:MAG: 3-oxoacyl-[acyl-carrier-protein] reductase [Coxiella sp. RIFCSPHIGHO2_12_FULL_44_14]|nr:MAG: 3-oxoacyl-[acyl-carrier-protein] reductase [Coxiella sp. RIFCSPHIGHO2_12_FULL_44_14]
MLTNKLALVTGASRGIGKAIAEALGRQGATVIGTATSENGANAISLNFKENNINGCGMVLDVASDESVEALFAKIKEEQGKEVEVLVNNAGITMDNIMVRMKLDQWDQVINTNLTSIYRMIRKVVRPMMKARAGRIINISSLSGVMGNFGQANYAAAKAGMIGLSKSVAQEMAPYGVTVNCVAPGFIQTDMVDQLSEAQLAKINEMVPMKRMGKPEEIASVVTLLASEGGAYITGETIHVNGGIYMS